MSDVREKDQGLDAPAIMKMRGEKTDVKVLDYVKNNPNSTIREISEALGMSNGRVDHSVNRLKDNAELEVQYFRRNRGLVKKVKLASTDSRDFNEIIYPLSHLTQDLWLTKAYLCAASRSAIIISPEIKKGWKEQCMIIEEAPLHIKNRNIYLKIPERFSDFYELPNSEIDVSGYDDELLVTIGTTIIPVETEDTSQK
jgi:DNA-binding Lrp family transcriptional regulator